MRLLFGAFIGASLLSAGQAHAIEDWENQKVIQLNTEKPHATMTAFADAVSAKSFDREKSVNFKLLNGDWKFNWVPKPADRPLDFYKIDFDISAWKTIPVPSNWEIEGYGVEIYTKSHHLNTAKSIAKSFNHSKSDCCPAIYTIQ